MDWTRLPRSDNKSRAGLRATIETLCSQFTSHANRTASCMLVGALDQDPAAAEAAAGSGASHPPCSASPSHTTTGGPVCNDRVAEQHHRAWTAALGLLLHPCGVGGTPSASPTAR